MTEPKISVIVPVYNVEAYLPRCLRNLCAQTLEEIEILLVDDGSTDGTGEICDRFAREDSRIRVIHQANAGVSAARNAALAICRGQYIGFADGDDVPALNLYEVLLWAAEETGSDAAICQYTLVDGETELGIVPADVPAAVLSVDSAAGLVMDFQKKVKVALWNKLLKRSTITGLTFDTNKYVAEDMEFLLKALLNANQAAYVPTGLYGYYAQRTGAAMNRADHSLDWYADQWQFIQSILEDIAAKRPSLRTLAVSCVCGNPCMAMANAMVRQSRFDPAAVRKIRKKLWKEMPIWLFSRLHTIKKVQMLVFLANVRLYSVLMKKFK